MACRIIAITCKCRGRQRLFRTYSNKEPHGILQTLVQLTYHIQYLRQNLDMVFHHLSQRTFLNIIPKYMSSFSCLTICSVHGNGFYFQSILVLSVDIFSSVNCSILRFGSLSLSCLFILRFFLIICSLFFSCLPFSHLGILESIFVKALSP